MHALPTEFHLITNAKGRKYLTPQLPTGSVQANNAKHTNNCKKTTNGCASKYASAEGGELYKLTTRQSCRTKHCPSQVGETSLSCMHIIQFIPASHTSHTLVGSFLPCLATKSILSHAQALHYSATIAMDWLTKYRKKNQVVSSQ